jgi:toxin secretion/phage lysis holin
MPDNVTRTMTGMVAGLLAWWADIPLVLQAMVCLTLLDYVSGMGKAMVNRALSSQVGYRGAVRKGLAFVLVAAGWVGHKKLGVPVPLDQIIAGFFCASEFISIVENCKQAGLGVPDGLAKYFQALKGDVKDAR